MLRVDFTKNITLLLSEMILAGDQPIIDYVLRSKEEQKRLFDLGLSKCDGSVRISAHQNAHAMDIYFANSNPNSDKSKSKASWWHKRWEQLGGKPMIEWDMNHFE